MTEIQAGLTVATVLVVPYIVQAIKTKAMTGNVARWIAIAVSAGFRWPMPHSRVWESRTNGSTRCSRSATSRRTNGRLRKCSA